MAKAKKLPSGNYRIRVYVGKDADGKEKFKSFTAPTKREAERAAALYEVEIAEKTANGKTVKEIIRGYIDAKQGVLSPSTLLGYERMIKAYHDLDDVPIMQLDALTIQTFVSEFAKTHSAKYTANVWGLLSAALALYRPDFAPKIRLPQKQKKDMYIPTDADMERLMEATNGTVLFVPFLLASRCGLRASEIAGLEKKNVNIKDESITIMQARVSSVDGPKIKAPKSRAGYRVIPCPKWICKMCMESDGPYVTMLSSALMTTRWSNFVRRHDLPVCGFHALRHYYASKAALLGIPKEYLVELMGHSSSRMLDQVYLHTFPDAKKHFAQLLSRDFTVKFDTIPDTKRKKTRQTAK